MELVFVVWILGVLPTIGEVVTVIGVAGIVLWFSIHSALIENYHIVKPHKSLLVVFISLLLVGAIVPNRETTYAMAAAYGVQTIVENETANELASDGVDVLKAWMKKAKTELEQSTEK